MEEIRLQKFLADQGIASRRKCEEFINEGKVKVNGEIAKVDMNKKEIIKKLTDKNNKQAYEYAKKIGIESSKTDKYLDMIPDFASMLQDKNSL